MTRLHFIKDCNPAVLYEELLEACPSLGEDCRVETLDVDLWVTIPEDSNASATIQILEEVIEAHSPDTKSRFVTSGLTAEQLINHDNLSSAIEKLRAAVNLTDAEFEALGWEYV